jgi:hypothetical protein
VEAEPAEDFAEDVSSSTTNTSEQATAPDEMVVDDENPF